LDFFNEALMAIDSTIEFNSASNGKELIEKLQLDGLMPQVSSWTSICLK
jgi:hypothetical protein